MRNHGFLVGASLALLSRFLPAYPGFPGHPAPLPKRGRHRRAPTRETSIRALRKQEAHSEFLERAATDRFRVIAKITRRERHAWIAAGRKEVDWTAELKLLRLLGR